MNLETNPVSPYFVGDAPEECHICGADSWAECRMCGQYCCEECMRRYHSCADCAAEWDTKIDYLLIDGPRNLMLRAFSQLSPAVYTLQEWNDICSLFETYLQVGWWSWEEGASMDAAFARWTQPTEERLGETA